MARSMRAQLGVPYGRISMRACCAAAHAEFVQADLQTGRGGCEALLVPLPSGCFRIVVDPTPRKGWGETPAGQRSALARHRTRFRIAHELAHTFFYKRKGGRPTRTIPAGSAAEEGFADEFARTLLAPASAGAVQAGEILSACTEWDVSLELAARAFAAVDGIQREIVLWRWPAKGPVVTQWSNGSRTQDVLGLHARTGSAELREALLAANKTLPGFSAVVADTRRQALTVLGLANAGEQLSILGGKRLALRPIISRSASRPRAT